MDNVSSTIISSARAADEAVVVGSSAGRDFEPAVKAGLRGGLLHAALTVPAGAVSGNSDPVPSRRRRALLSLFQAIDYDRDGFVTASELQLFGQSPDRYPSDATSRALCALLLESSAVSVVSR